MAKPAVKTPTRPAQDAKPTPDKNKPGQQVATQKSGVPAEAMPDYMKGDTGKGAEGLGMGDIEVPRIKLIQAISPEIKTHDMDAGVFFHTITEESLGEELEIIPVFVSKAYILWRPRPPIDSGGMLARAMDGVHWSPSTGEFQVKTRKGQKEPTIWKLAATVAQSGLDAWGTSDPEDTGSPPAATQMINVAAILPAHLDLSPVVITLQRAGLKVGKKFAGKLKMSQIPIFGRKFMMRSVDDSSQAGAFKNYSFEGIGQLGEEDLDVYNMGKGFYESFKRMGLNIKDIDNLQGETDQPGAAGDEAEDGSAKEY